MASFGIWMIRVLRKLPITAAFDEHLTRCAFAEILADEHLTLGKVLGWSRIESGVSHIDAGWEGIDTAVLFRNNAGGDRLQSANKEGRSVEGAKLKGAQRAPLCEVRTPRKPLT